MNLGRVLTTVFGALRAQFTRIWTKLRLLFSLTFWQTKVFTKLRQFFTKLFSVKPRHKKDYYPVARWLVSKRLAFAIVVVLGVLCVFYLLVISPLSAALSSEGSPVAIRTFKYSSFPLKFQNGTVRITAQSGYTAFEGNVADGYCEGEGTLFGSAGNILYKGAFSKSMYNGNGTQYYNEGGVKYVGDFVDNLYHGIGSLYRPSGSLEHTGSYENGLWNGPGKLFNAGGNQIFDGNFQNGRLIYSEFLGKTAQDVARMYTGKYASYTGADGVCVEMSELASVYTLNSGADTLEQEWTVSGVYVLDSSISLGGHEISTINDLTALFGAPHYFGSTYLDMPEAVAINLLRDEKNFGKIDMQLSRVYDDVFDVLGYNRSFEVYIYAYEFDGLVYTFYCRDGGSTGFSMYKIAPAEQ